MYKKGAALELQFSSARLNNGAGNPYWIDLSVQEATLLHAELSAFLAKGVDMHAGPLIVSLDESAHDDTHKSGDTAVAPEPVASAFSQWVCLICGWIYDEAAGDPEHGIPAGTRWRDVPGDWRCPLCDVGKDDFALIEF
ncbi:Rubredoxin [Burkholderia sp. 8Y]|uniref:rubredoxin n=1 Tax=Burkholderia sp. 8Y TaxID=2653133 RepID=UPI0012F07030|nr:rubredoxin [Burkholderia sp. 8Y]VXB42613.1 Rubredoxin [Burkholderia sp. 8Y]